MPPVLGGVGRRKETGCPFQARESEARLGPSKNCTCFRFRDSKLGIGIGLFCVCENGMADMAKSSVA